MTRRRYRVVLLLFCVIFVNYMDRVNFSVAIPAIRQDLGYSLHQIGEISFVWALAYALCNAPGGWVAERLGLRWGLAGALGVWSVFTIATPFATGLTGWLVLRAAMGAGEAPIWACNAMTAATWVPAEERSTAYSLAGSGEFLGPAIGTLLAGVIAAQFGWRWSFILFGLAGLLLLPVWTLVVGDSPAEDPRVGPEERALIGGGTHRGRPDWAGLRAVVLSRVGCGILLTFMTSGYVLFTFQTWLPTYMHDTFHSSIVGGAAWASLSAGLGFVGFLLAGPVNDAMAKRMDRLTARRLGTVVPTLAAILFLLASLATAAAQSAWATAVLIGCAQLLSTMTVGAWAVSVIDLSPSRASTGILYGFYNGMLNLMGAVNGLMISSLASRFGFPAAFASAVAFMILFMAGMALVVDRPGYERLLHRAEEARRSEQLRSA